MTEYQTIARSNYFKVKEVDKFQRWAQTRHIEVISEERKGEMYHTMYSDAPEFGGWCRLLYDKDTQDHTHIDLEAELSTHLQDGSVAVLMEVGNDSIRSFKGNASAVNSKGEVVAISLWDIYEVASELGDEVTEEFG